MEATQGRDLVREGVGSALTRTDDLLELLTRLPAAQGFGGDVEPEQTGGAGDITDEYWPLRRALGAEPLAVAGVGVVATVNPLAIIRAAADRASGSQGAGPGASQHCAPVVDQVIEGGGR